MSSKSVSSVISDNNSRRKASWLSLGHGGVGPRVGLGVGGPGTIGGGVGGRVRGGRVGRDVSSVGPGVIEGACVGDADEDG